jgi:hypothetical protein
MDILVNQAVKIPFIAVGLTTGKTVFTPSPIFLKDGISTVVSPTYTEIGNGLYTINFTPAATGEWTIFLEGQIQAKFTVVTRTMASIVADIWDESIGSWAWDKNTGVLTVLRGDGSTLATYNVVDTISAASRERLT